MLLLGYGPQPVLTVYYTHGILPQFITTHDSWFTHSMDNSEMTTT